jgi:hypothetical protein
MRLFLVRWASLLNALCLRDEAFGHTTKTRDHHQANTTGEPAAKATAAFVVPGRHAQAGDADHGSDDVAAPVHDVEDGALNGGRLLPLNYQPEGRLRAQVLCAGPDCGERKELTKQHEQERNPNPRMGPVALCGTLHVADGGNTPIRAKQVVASALIRFFSWTRLLLASVSQGELRMGSTLGQIGAGAC